MSIQQNFPSTRPSLSINFARSQRLDPRITFTRTSSATRVNSDGLIEVVPANSPRFDFDPISGESLGLLVEEQRTNLLKWSEDFNGFDWTKGAAGTALLPVVTSNQSIAPDGSNTADLVVFDLNGSTTVNDRSQISQSYTTEIGKSYIFSVWIKTSDDTIKNIRLSFNGGNPNNPNYHPTGIVTVNGSWQRYIIGINSATNNILFPRISLRVGTETSDFASVYLWGAQFEEGTFPTSYIPTTTSTVTRTADNARIIGSNFSDFYNPSEGTLITNVNLPFRILTGARSFALDDGTTSYMIDLTNTTNSVTLEGLENSSYTNIRTISNSTSKIMKQATSFNSSNQTISVNGEVTTPSSTSLSISRYKNLRIASQVNNSAYLNGYIQQLVYYPTALPSNQLITLTK
jgi:hypothetical protein